MDTLVLILIIVSVTLFANWLNYCLGSPLADRDYDLRAILAWIPERLSRRRLKRTAFYQYRKALDQLKEEMETVKGDPIVIFDVGQDHRRHLYELGRRFFTWEKAFLCQVCLHWWLTVIFVGVLLALGIQFDHLTALLAYLLTHFLIKKF